MTSETTFPTLKGDQKVLSLRGATPQGEPNERVVEFLRDALEAAERGEIAAVGIIKVQPNGEIGTGYRGQSGMKHNHLITAGALYLIHDIAKED